MIVGIDAAAGKNHRPRRERHVARAFDHQYLVGTIVAGGPHDDERGGRDGPVG
jgi:hypothetical protein